MDHVNKTLHISLKQDIEIITETLETIEVHSDVKSWIFPTKDPRFVKEFIDANRVYEYGNTELYLELLLDRLYVGLRFILHDLEKAVNHEIIEDSIFLQRPRQITIGCCFVNLWKIVRRLAKKMAEKDNHSTINSRNLVVNIGKHAKTQTDSVTLDKCDSCASAITCMKSLLDIFEEFNGDETIKRKIRPRIFDITQFGSMLQSTISVEDNLKILVGKLLEKNKENDELQKELKKLEDENKGKDGKIIFLEQEVKAYKEQFRKKSIMLASLSKQQEEFVVIKSESDKEKEGLKELILKLNESSGIDEITIKSLKNANRKMNEFFKMSLQFQRTFVNEIAGLQRNIETIENEQECITDVFRQFEMTIDDLNTKLINISKCHNATEYKIKTLNDDWLENIPNLIVKFKEYKENIYERMLERSVNSMENIPIIPKFQIKGNPLEDITRQMEENKEKIRQMMEENEKLQTIICRFKCIKK